MYPLPNFLIDVEGGFPMCDASRKNAVGCTFIRSAKRGETIEINSNYKVTVGKEVKSIVVNGNRIVPIVAIERGRVTESLTRHELNHWYYYIKYNDLDIHHKRNYCK